MGKEPVFSHIRCQSRLAPSVDTPTAQSSSYGDFQTPASIPLIPFPDFVNRIGAVPDDHVACKDRPAPRRNIKLTLASAVPVKVRFGTSRASFPARHISP